ncbi:MULTISPECIES: acyl-CoA thioesterase [Hyphobacterium]|uniref:Acyl-CoA thioesterase n=1 Tax=Hyphobacterium vulgare TaxID=1736751 RepID=A0ABV6ZVU7_9PROT
MSGPQRTRGDYRWWDRIATRWNDNDVYGHMNNVVHYALFDTAVNRYLITEAGLDIHGGGVIGLVVETGCQYFAALAYPETVEAGVRVARIGTSSVTYEIGLYSENSGSAAAEGRFTHVYVDRQTRRPVPLPAEMRAGLERISI